MADILSESQKLRKGPNVVIITSTIVASMYISEAVCAILCWGGVVGELLGRIGRPWILRSGTRAAGDAIRVLTLKMNTRDERQRLGTGNVKLITTASSILVVQYGGLQGVK